RGTRMIVDELGLSYEQAKNLLLLHGNVKTAIEIYKNQQK
ncbi:MAG: N-acetylmuramic acid 6-phosphate etherase, partial [Petrimonas sp.]|nr:N-acetylmuramic acid 6-phosphate etherase [Petrimonas sp.]